MVDVSLLRVGLRLVLASLCVKVRVARFCYDEEGRASLCVKVRADVVSMKGRETL